MKMMIQLLNLPNQPMNQNKNRVFDFQTLQSEKQRLQEICNTHDRKMMVKINEFRENYLKMAIGSVFPFKHEKAKTLLSILGILLGIILPLATLGFKNRGNTRDWRKTLLTLAFPVALKFLKRKLSKK